MFDRLPTPFGLVRAGVAPDHQKIKARHPRLRPGRRGPALPLLRLRRIRHRPLHRRLSSTTTRCCSPRARLRSAHGHPRRGPAQQPPRHRVRRLVQRPPGLRRPRFDLSQERVAIVGDGNVAIDVARILCLTPEELASHGHGRATRSRRSRDSGVREVHLLGRRGPAQAAFTNPELKELGELAEADIVVDPAEVRAGRASAPRRSTESGDKSLKRKSRTSSRLAPRAAGGHASAARAALPASRPWSSSGDGAWTRAQRKLARNRLEKTPHRRQSAPRPPASSRAARAALVFRSVGYAASRSPDVPFNDRWGVILNDKGRVVDPETHAPVPGVYVTGWIKRGPSGVIGTNKPDSAETVAAMLQDAAVASPSNRPTIRRCRDRAHPRAPAALRDVRRLVHVWTRWNSGAAPNWAAAQEVHVNRSDVRALGK